MKLEVDTWDNFETGAIVLMSACNPVLQNTVQGKMKVGCIDIKSAGAKELGSEYNVRKHNVPQCRVLVSRARAASKVALNDDDGILFGADAIAEGCMSTVSCT